MPQKLWSEGKVSSGSKQPTEFRLSVGEGGVVLVKQDNREKKGSWISGLTIWEGITDSFILKIR